MGEARSSGLCLALPTDPPSQPSQAKHFLPLLYFPLLDLTLVAFDTFPFADRISANPLPPVETASCKVAWIGRGALNRGLRMIRAILLRTTPPVM